MAAHPLLLHPSGDAGRDREELGPVPHGAALIRDGRIADEGPDAGLPACTAADAGPADCGGRLVAPGLTGHRTRRLHGGGRSDAFAMRLPSAACEAARAGVPRRILPAESLFRRGFAPLHCRIRPPITGRQP